jgi:sterol desaturase/sphingolipid hydroxylase (fatty acid hydroxylase superfamily)
MKQIGVWAIELVLSDAFLLMCLMFLVVGLLERVIPAHKLPARQYRLNLCYAFVNIVAITAITPFISAGTAFAIQKIGLGLIDLQVIGFEGALGGLAAMLIGALILDFFVYWEHRFLHANKVMWQQHLLHHSDEYMNVTTAARQHLLENLCMPLFVTIPVAILFRLPPVDIAAVSLIPFAWLYLSHANIRLSFGPLWWVLTSPDYHRIHHSLEADHIDKNFVAWFPIWDILFGTAVVPRKGQYPSTGVAGVSVQTVVQAYLLPFAGWRHMFWQHRSLASTAPISTSGVDTHRPTAKLIGDIEVRK